ncbi:hypothetical protein [uncultured Methanobrevibacter sp.]|uniref:hypothetical protein n=1 Tax=uncultured Methanobrevibacter sp. TaxID=253161 RepID=UPI0025FAE0C2|nr:hypothetical protein [uncultured Methanobrevibacter sp.]
MINSDVINDVFLDVLLQDTPLEEIIKHPCISVEIKYYMGKIAIMVKKIIRSGFMILDFLQGLSTRNDD